jgi:hypothetical protein
MVIEMTNENQSELLAAFWGMAAIYADNSGLQFLSIIWFGFFAINMLQVIFLAWIEA